MSAPVVLMAGGGTGGHIYPLLAVAEELRRRASVQIVFVGTPRGMETTILPARGEKLELLDVDPIAGKGPILAAKGAAKAALVLPRARQLVSRYAPKIVLSIGGYAAGPVSLAARTLGIPVALLEPNSVLGFTNRLSAPFVRRAYVAFSEVTRHFRRGIALCTGVPLRATFQKVPYAPRDDMFRLLVWGGSQGARRLNEVVPEGIARAASALCGLQVVHQAGKADELRVRRSYEERGLSSRVIVTPFLEDMATQFARADLVIQRAGAGALAELCAIGRPSILVPFPHAAADHQRRNAEALASEGAALCIEQSQLSPERLATALLHLADDRSKLRAMAELSSLHGKSDATRVIASDLLTIAGIPIAQATPDPSGEPFLSPGDSDV